MNRKIIETIGNQSWFFKGINKIDRLLVTLTRKRGKKFTLLESGMKGRHY